MGRIIAQIQHAWEDSTGFSEKAPLVWRIIFSFLIGIPLLYLAGFLSACILFKNPFEAGAQVVESMF